MCVHLSVHLSVPLTLCTVEEEPGDSLSWNKSILVRNLKHTKHNLFSFRTEFDFISHKFEKFTDEIYWNSLYVYIGKQYGIMSRVCMYNTVLL